MDRIIAVVFLLVLSCPSMIWVAISEPTHGGLATNPRLNPRTVIEVKGGGRDSIIWVVQLSDLHFSVHHPDRAIDFRELVGPVLSVIRPALVLVTGDLTDGKSKDLLTMKQDEQEWVEYLDVMNDVVKRSGLDKRIFYDLRGNHDKFGVPIVGGSCDFFSNYSLNAQLGRSGNVNSVTIETHERRHLFVGIDSSMAVGLRGPTNVFGHPVDELLADLDKELSQWENEPSKPVTKVSFGHFPLSFSCASESQMTLKDVFLKHAISAYLCGHLHTRFGKNLKRHHKSSSQLVQLNMHNEPESTVQNCSKGVPQLQEFWEWEMGDWRKSRAMRILAIDRGHASFVDLNFKLGVKKTIILVTFPLDSRLMWTSSLLHDYECQSIDTSSFKTIRALVFSASPIIAAVVKVYDSHPGQLIMVLEAAMTKDGSDYSGGAVYRAPWNFKAFEDLSPHRYWLQIEAIDITGKSTFSDFRPFSINGLRSRLSWTWWEFMVMGCQWPALYYPLLWFSIGCALVILLFPMALHVFSRKQHTFKNFCSDKGFLNGLGWILSEFYRLRVVWSGVLVYLLSLFLFPWFAGQVFTDYGERVYMTYKGWARKPSDLDKKLEYLGYPDVMVVVIPHLCFVVLPSISAMVALTAEREIYRIHFLLLAGKKDDSDHEKECSVLSKLRAGTRWIRKLVMLLCLVILWKHWKSCKAMMKAYEMSPLLHFPVYALAMPLLLASTVYKTRKV